MTRGEYDVAIVGGGIGGLTLALALERVGVSCRVFEAAPELLPIGVGINLLPHATKILSTLGLESDLAHVAVETKEAGFFNRFGQHIYSEPLGRFAGFDWPQFSIHRGDLQSVLLEAVHERLGDDAVALGHRCVDIDQTDESVVIHFEDPDGRMLESQRSTVAIGCDGVHSVVRNVVNPGGSELRYTGVHMWRGVTISEPFLSRATMVRAGWLASGKMVIYPIRDNADGQGRQLINWVAELERTRYQERDWNREGDADDFIEHFEDWHFDWLDVPELIQGAETILEYPMVDQEPLDTWTDGRVTLLGDAAHPMVPRGSNGAGQAILDAWSLAENLRTTADAVEALTGYEAERRPASAAVVRMSRTEPPDAILREVYERSGDQPFERVEDVISEAELSQITERYRVVAGYSKRDLS